MQSGSDRILKEMNRHYTIDYFLDLCDYAQKTIPNVSLTTDVIVGFPGETEEDFNDTLTALEKVKFDSVFSFIYSPRKGTRAAVMPSQVDESIKKDRMNRLLNFQQKISAEKNQRLVGLTLRVILEGESKNDKNVWSGRTDQGKIIHFPKTKGNFVPGQHLWVEVERAESYTIYGKIKERG